LLIGIVVASLELILGNSARVPSDGGSTEQACPGTDGRTGPRVTRGSTDQRTQAGPYHRTDGRSGSQVFIGGLAWRCSSDLPLRPLSADPVIRHEHLKGLSRTGHH